MIRSIKSGCICLFVLLLSIPGYSEIYKYVDKNGNLVFTNDPTTIPANMKKQVEIKPEIKRPPEKENSIPYEVQPVINKAAPARATRKSTTIPALNKGSVPVVNPASGKSAPDKKATSSSHTSYPGAGYKNNSSSSLTQYDKSVINALRRLGYIKTQDYGEISHQEIQYMEVMFKYAFGIENITTWQADPKFSSPEETWNLHKRALKNGNIDLAVECFMPREKNDRKELYKTIGALRMKEIADSMRPIERVTSDESGAKYRITRSQVINGQQYNVTYYIYFNNIFGEWKIEHY